MPFATEVVVGLAMIVAGHIGWTRRPESRIGPLLVIAGLLHLVWELTETPWPITFTAGFLVAGSGAYVLAHALLTFPTGRAASGVDRAVLVGLYAIAAGFLVMRLFIDTTEQCDSCPQNMGLVADEPSLADGLFWLTNLGLLGVSTAFVALIVGRWRRASPAARRALAPPLAVAALGGLLGVIEGTAELWLPSVSGLHGWWFWAERLIMLAAPLSVPRRPGSGPGCPGQRSENS